MSQSTWKEFKLKLESIELQYSNTVTREMRMNIQNLKYIGWLSIADQNSWALPVLQNFSYIQ